MVAACSIFLLLIFCVGDALGADYVDLPVDFPVPVESETAITAGAVEGGDTLTFVVSAPVRKDGCLVFREKSPVIVVVRRGESPGFIGKGSLIDLEILWSTAADGTRVFLRGRIQVRGEDREMESIGVAAGICCLGLFIRGEETKLGSGVGTLAFTRDAVRLECGE